MFESQVDELKTGKLEMLKDLAQKQINIEESIELLEASLKLEKQILEEVSRVDIPNLLEETGLSRVKLKSGEEITISDRVKASVNKSNKETVYKAMIDNLTESLRVDEKNKLDEIKSKETATKIVDSLWKSKITIDYTKENRDLLLRVGVPYEPERSIHFQTLNKFCKDLLEKGDKIPEGINIFTYKETKIKK